MKKIVCQSCEKCIDENSRFCKYCGYSVGSTNVNVHNEEKLVRIFQGMCKTICMHSEYLEEEFEEEFKEYKSFDNRPLSDNDYYLLLVDIVFYSGFKATIVDKYKYKIREHFPDYQDVRNYSLYKIEEINNDPNMIQHKLKIDACVKNAKKVADIVNKYGSMKDYVESFNPNSSDEALYSLKRSLENDFSFIGNVTSYHFMKDIHLNVLKPDRVILRIFKRLGLIANENDLHGAVKIGQAISKVTNYPIRFIDIMFVLYGQLDQDKFECICSAKNPKCDKCGIKSDCLYAVGRA